MSTTRVYPVPEAFARQANIDQAGYREAYRRSVDDPDGFWAEQAEALVTWTRRWDRVRDVDFGRGDIKWFVGGQLNVAANCLDRHVAERGDKPAIVWEPNDPAEATRTLSYRDLHAEVCRFANALQAAGVGKGDTVAIYMPMIPETAVAMLACARLGAVHSVVFGGFSPRALADRIRDAGAKYVVTADEGRRGARTIPLKANVDAALAECPDVATVFVVEHTGADVPRTPGRDIDYAQAIAGAAATCPAVAVDAEDPLFILYTSGSTGTPKGLVHTSGGYLVYASLTHRLVFDHKEDDIYWCAADVGWVTGHSYVVYGPLANGATVLMFEGIPDWPDGDRVWQIIDKHQVTIFYTAPTMLRALMAKGDDLLSRTTRASLRVLGTVGEPINPEAWEWYYHHIGGARSPIVDTWWQTETGGIMLTPLPGATALKPGCATQPFLGVRPGLVDDDGRQLDGPATGNLVMLDAWPGIARTIRGDHARYLDTYFTRFPGKYTAGDAATRDADGDYWIIGRTDDVLNVSGHRLGTAEIESALVLHPAVAEAAVVGIPHAIKGEAIYAFVTTMAGTTPSDALRAELVQWVRQEIGPVATPETLQWAPALPKTRSGKIMRRILRKVATDNIDDLGDTSTLADPEVVDKLIAERPARTPRKTKD